jgi:DNA-binding transcriptional ArsR family regulator
MRSYARALGSGTRLRILQRLSENLEQGVAELSEAVGHSPPLVSWHVRRLRQAGLVRARREGRLVKYSLVADQLEALHQELTTYLEHLVTVHTAHTSDRPNSGAARS